VNPVNCRFAVLTFHEILKRERYQEPDKWSVEQGIEPTDARHRDNDQRNRSECTQRDPPGKDRL